MMKFSTCFLFLSISVAVVSCGRVSYDQTDSEYWNDLSRGALHASLKNDYGGAAKNVIIFLGDGMGISTITAARTLRRQREQINQLGFETFPNVALIKTYNVDYQVPDSAGTATAYLTGVKTNKGVIGLNGKVPYKDGDCENIQRNKVASVFERAIASGKVAGVVTTTSLTDASPAGTYAHVSDRHAEASTPIADGRCKDIARQLIEDRPGADFTVLLGGGTRFFTPPPVGIRKDGQDLLALWKAKKAGLNLTAEQYQLVRTRQELAKVKKDKVKYLFGHFAPKHLLYDAQRRNSSTSSEPSIAEMTEAAIQVLSQNAKGFFLFVEGGKIDKAHHQNWASLALQDTLAFDAAIDRALNLVDLRETLVIVTADHSHGFTQNGYSKRDSDMFGFAEEKSNNTPYTSLMYATGPGGRALVNETAEQTQDTNYRQRANVWLDSAAHSGEDVAAYAIGAMSHLMRSTQEQTYVAHLMSFAACLSPYQDEDHCQTLVGSSATKLTGRSQLLLLLPVVSLLVALLTRL